MAGVGIGLVFSGLITATSRNPALRPLLVGVDILLYAGTCKDISTLSE